MNIFYIINKNSKLIVGFIFFLTINAVFGYKENNLDEEKSNFNMDWRLYQYNIQSYINIIESTSVNERYYLRNQVKEIMLKKISVGIENMFVDNTHKIMDILDQNSDFRQEYPLFMQSINIVRMTFRNSMIEVSTALPMRGGRGLLSHIPLPWGTMSYNPLLAPEYVGEAYAKTSVGNEYESGLIPIKYSGVIIDLRGMDINEAFAPRIFSQTGRLIYGPEFILSKIGIQRGIVAYTHDISDSEVRIRAGDSPYFTVALATRGLYKTDVVISNKDAARLLQHAVTIENLQKCRVVFLVDNRRNRKK